MKNNTQLEHSVYKVFKNQIRNRTVFSILFFLLTFSQYSFAQLHSTVSCNNSVASGTLIWETAPTNSSEFDWTPDGALTNTFNNISGSGVNATISFSGDTGTLSGWNFGGGDTPEVDFDNGTEALQFFTTGFNATGITITITFSQPVNAVGFDLGHVNGQGPNGDSYTITASEVGGGTLFPTFTESATPSYTTNTSGFVDSNNNSTAGDNDEVGVNFSSSNGINSITLVWDECTACTAGTVHGSSIKDISFCVSADPCDSLASGNPDSDLDGLSDICDDDDDNDGILDINEGFSTTNSSAPACGSQTVLNFNNAFTEEPGGDGNNTTFLQGETFRFPSVAAGIDALVTIVTLNGTTLPTLDDNGSNPNSFQPQSAFNLTNIGDQAYTEFRFDFVSTGGTVGVNDVIIPEFFVNFNDVDGNSNYGEQNWSQLPVGYFVDDPTELTINTVDNFVVGTSGVNEYPGVTNTFPQVNYATQHSGKSSYTIRLGVIARVAGASAGGRQHNVEFDCASNFSNPSSTTTVDTDGDGIADHLDTDSDDDGCPDAVEGSLSILSSQLDGNDRIPGPVSSNGVPNAANGGSGQGAGSSTNASISACEPTAVDDTASVDEDDTVNIVVLDDDNFGGDGPSTGTIT
ncbi:hypothetical protein EYD45_05170, partial [Hyunsoonleella flava]